MNSFRTGQKVLELETFEGTLSTHKNNNISQNSPRLYPHRSGQVWPSHKLNKKCKTLLHVIV